MKSKFFSAVTLLLILSALAFAQNPILELHDNKIPGRKLLVFSDGRYQFFPFPGTRPSEGVAVFEKAGKCGVKFSDNQVAVLADKCVWTGMVTAVRVEAGQLVTYTLTDRIENVPPRK